MPSTIEDQIATYCRWVEERGSVSMRPPAASEGSDTNGDAFGAGEPTAAGHGRGRARSFVLAVAVVVAGGALVGALVAVTRPASQRLTPAVPPTPTVPMPASTLQPEPIQTASSPTTVAEATVAVVPPKASEGDPRDPIQRFLGVPADPGEAFVNGRLAMDQAIADCMTAAGFYYAVPQPTEGGIRQGTADYEAAIHDPGGCDEQANARVYLLPSLQTEFDELDRAIRADPSAIEASTALMDCLDANGFDPSVTATASPAACDADNAHNTEVLSALMEQMAPAWIEQHRVALETRRDDLADLVARARSHEATYPTPAFTQSPFEVTGLRVGDPMPTDGDPTLGIGPDREFDPTLVPEWIPVARGTAVVGFIYGPHLLAGPSEPGSVDPAGNMIFYGDDGRPIARYGSDGLPQLEG